ncbi:MAG: hypothetical protein ABI318_11795 [Chthoniobacteraceae bacterium]
MPAKPASHAQAIKTTISYFPADEAAIRAIRAAMIQHGHDCTISTAVRLALRSVPVKKGALSAETVEQFAALLSDMGDEDGRKVRHA